MTEIEKTWEFCYRTLDDMRAANPGWESESEDDLEYSDLKSFYSKSDNFDEACKEFDEFERDVELWDVDPEASFNHGEEYRSIIGKVNYNGF